MIDIETETRFAKQKLEDYIVNLDNAKHDRLREYRLQSQECPVCYYMIHHIAGSAFTGYTCAMCKEYFSWPNTATPSLCHGCAKKDNLCIECGSEMFEYKDVVVTIETREKNHQDYLKKEEQRKRRNTRRRELYRKRKEWLRTPVRESHCCPS